MSPSTKLALFSAVFLVICIKLVVAQTCTGTWSGYGAWEPCQGVNGWKNCTCGGDTCCIQKRYRTCTGPCVTPICTGFNEEVAPCGMTRVCTFPTPTCCQGFKRVASTTVNMISCVTNPDVTTTTTSTTTTTTTPMITTAEATQGCQFSKLTQADRDLVVQVHNNYRSKLAKGTAANKDAGTYASGGQNIYKIEYDCKLENLAQAWSNTCNYQHSKDTVRKCAGENMYWSSSTTQAVADALQQASDLWWKELPDCGLSTSDTTFNTSYVCMVNGQQSSLGHFTQMAWASTIRIGCGVANCPSGTGPTTGTIVTCNYNMTGNINSNKIYELGSTCSNCTTYPGSSCDASLGLCVAPAGDSECADKQNQASCDYFKGQGYCDESSQFYCFVRRDCAKTCGICDK